MEDDPEENAATFPTVFISRKEEKTKNGVKVQTVDNFSAEKIHFEIKFVSTLFHPINRR